MNITQLKDDIDFLCGSTSANYLVVDKIRNINIAYQEVARLIWESSTAWQYDDKNQTTLPIAYSSLSHTQQDYSLPSTAQRIHRIEILNAEGSWEKLTQIDWKDIQVAMPEYTPTPGMPLYYDLVGSSVLLFPAPSSAYATLASGMAVYVERDVVEFALTATTTTPGFATGFHRLLSVAASLDFEKDETERKKLIFMKDRLEKGLTKFYGARNIERQSNITPRSKQQSRRYT